MVGGAASIAATNIAAAIVSAMTMVEIVISKLRMGHTPSPQKFEIQCCSFS
jgi:hypothetical protein